MHQVLASISARKRLAITLIAALAATLFAIQIAGSASAATKHRTKHHAHTSGGDGSAIELNYRAKNVYLVAGGTGTVTVMRNGQPTTVPIGGPPTSHQIVAGDQVVPATLEVRASQGVQLFSFTYG